MGKIVATELTAPLDACNCSWGRVKCPNPPEFIIVGETEKTVFCIMCEPHRIGFEEDYGPAAGKYRVELYTLELATELCDRAKLEKEQNEETI